MEEDVHYNRKKITIREGHRDYTNGPVMIGCHLLDWCVMRKIIDVRHTTLKEVTPEEYQNDGFTDKDILIHKLKQFYPAIGWASPVTIVRWE